MCTTTSQIPWAVQEMQVPCLWPQRSSRAHFHFCFIIVFNTVVESKKITWGNFLMKSPTAADYVAKKQWPIKTASPASFLTRKRSLWQQIPVQQWNARKCMRPKGTRLLGGLLFSCLAIINECIKTGSLPYSRPVLTTKVWGRSSLCWVPTTSLHFSNALHFSE